MNNSNRAVEIGLLSGKNMELLLKIQKKLSKKKFTSEETTLIQVSFITVLLIDIRKMD